MLCMRIHYLTGRACAARFEDGDLKEQAEWPPHPSRLFSALVDAWGECGEDPAEREVLEWLERQEPPEIYYTPYAERRNVTVFAPINDESVAKKLGATLVESRARKPRRFPSVAPLDPQVFFLWPRAELSAERQKHLEGLCSRVYRLGHSASLVEVNLTPGVPADHERLLPDPNGLFRIRVPYRSRFKELVENYRRFREDPLRQFRPSRGLAVSYGEKLPERPALPRSHFAHMMVFRQTAGEPVGLRGTLQVTAALRAATLRLGPQPSPECLSGHAPASTPEAPVRSERAHLAWITLANVGHRHADGRVMGVAALVPAELNQQEVGVCLATVRKIHRLNVGQLGEWLLEPATEETLAWTLRASSWMGPAQHWATVTPFVFDRFPDDPYGEEAERVVAAACERIGLTRPAAVTLTQISPHFGVPPSFAFPAAPARPGKPQRFHLHVILSFPGPVQGPLVIGAGRYYGYGVCRPMVS